jgi:hypothetical protein
MLHGLATCPSLGPCLPHPCPTLAYPCPSPMHLCGPRGAKACLAPPALPSASLVKDTVSESHHDPCPLASDLVSHAYGAKLLWEVWRNLAKPWVKPAMTAPALPCPHPPPPHPPAHAMAKRPCAHHHTIIGEPTAPRAQPHASWSKPPTTYVAHAAVKSEAWSYTP